jgi:hypothetical protein
MGAPSASASQGIQEGMSNMRLCRRLRDERPIAKIVANHPVNAMTMAPDTAGEIMICSFDDDGCRIVPTTSPVWSAKQ